MSSAILEEPQKCVLDSGLGEVAQGAPKQNLLKTGPQTPRAPCAQVLVYQLPNIMLGIMGVNGAEVGRISGLCMKTKIWKSGYAFCLVALLLKLEKTLFDLNTQRFFVVFIC